MATMKANGDAERFWRNSRNGSRVVLCRNGKLLINPGGQNGWKHSSLKLEDLTERDGWFGDNSTAAKAALTKTKRDAAVKRGA